MILNTIKYQYLAIIWGLIILVLCDAPMPYTTGISFFEGFDKLVHTGIFFVLTVLLFVGSIRQHRSSDFRIGSVIKIFIFTILFGAGIELLQKEVFTYRSADLWDLFADLVGIGMGIFSYILLHNTWSGINEKLT